MSTAQQYRKRPIVIEAVIAQDALNAAAANWSWLPEWLREGYDLGKVIFLADRVEISTLEGNMTALRDDWIIRGVKGELYPCKPSIFAATYEPVVEDHSFTVTLNTTEAVGHTTVRCLCGGIDGTHVLGCPELKFVTVTEGAVG